MTKFRRALGIAFLTLATIAPVLATASPVAAAGPSTIEVEGRGWGHGRWMSQYGAWGYARDHGWTSGQILSHYYGGTFAGDVASADTSIDPGYFRVNLQGMHDVQSVIIGVGGGSTLSISGAPGVTIPAAHKAVRLDRAGSSWTVYSGSGCGGPWEARGTGSNLVTVGRSSGSDQLMLCQSGKTTWYPGSLRVYTDGSITRTINITTLEEYLRSVVPAEMPYSWHPEALEAQAVAARSYAMAGETRSWLVGSPDFRYADTCDTIYCQVYRGHAEKVGNGSKVAKTHAPTDAAVQTTAGVVRIYDGTNRVARTEFASTSGGWTAGGTFPAVEDLGDSISYNTRHTWTVTKSVSPLESRCGGDFQRLVVRERNGLGAGGGRVLRADLVCSNRTMSVSGDEIRVWLGLWSNWWSVDGLDCAEAPSGTYVDAVHRLFLKRAATAGERAQWCGAVEDGGRRQLTNALSVSDEWAGTRVDELYRLILGRGADADGRANWVGFIAAGNRLEDVAIRFYGSAEYFQRIGATNRAFVESLYEKILHRSADAQGRDNWVHQLDSGAKSRAGVAAGFYASIESRRDRVTALYLEILGRQPDSGGMAHWSDRLRTHGDIDLAAQLAASNEYYQRVT